MKPISELLVETIARLACAPEGSAAACDTPYDVQAADIIASVYGPPCREFVRMETDYVGGGGRVPPMPKFSFAPNPNALPGKACARCEWPKSFHA